jgi:methyltransferase family protein
MGGSSTKIIWETNDPLGAEVHVSTPQEGDKLVTRGQSGSVEVSWIAASRTYSFSLYGSTEPGRCLDHVTVRRSDGSLEGVLNLLAVEASSGNIDLGEVARLVAKVTPRCLHSTRFPEFFRLWEEHGLHITPVHFYQPIPDTRTLPESIWDKPSALAGVDMNEAVQLDLLRNCFPKFRDEYEQFTSDPTDRADQFHFNNGRFDGTDALVAYCMVRHFQPRLIMEIGSGYSSLISAEAAIRNKSTRLICIEPFPLDFLVTGFPGLSSLVRKKVEDLELDFFAQLQPGDILFIDSSHTVKIGGDVNYLFLEVLPRLKPGVIVHVHDILFPLEYRREWVMDEHRFWTEQYLLQAFLAFNSDFEILISNSYLGVYYLKDLKSVFPNSPWWGGGSLWMRRKRGAQPITDSADSLGNGNAR